MKRQCIKENITSALNDLVYLYFLALYIYLFIMFLLVCLYALLYNVQLICFSLIVLV